MATLTAETNLSASRVRKSLSRLHAHGLVDRHPEGWLRTVDVDRDQVAVQLGVDGYLAGRAARYDLERAVWAWWLADVTWMSKARKKRRGRRSTTGMPLFTQNDRPDYPAYPRRNGRGHYRDARDLVQAGALQRPARLADERLSA